MLRPTVDDLPPPQPQALPTDATLPHRKILREGLRPFARRSTPRALWLLGLDLLLEAALVAGAALFDSLVLQTACGILAGLVIGRLFIIGHDACHQSLTPRRSLNRWLGRIAFLPSLTPYSLWDMGHNVVHHGFTNLKGVDFVWAPLTRAEYQALGPGRRWLQRLYRSGWAPGLYYLLEIWWHRMMARDRTAQTERPVYARDCRLVTTFALLWLAGVVGAAVATGRAPGHAAFTVFAAFVLPLLVWFTMIGFVVYVHHTHPRISWHDDRAAWQRAQPFVSTTVHLVFPWRIGALVHHIMEHTAHHVDMSIPLYRLRAAQARMEELLPGRIVIQHFSWRWYFATARTCKLYDFERAAWTDFHHRPTATPPRHAGGA